MNNAMGQTLYLTKMTTVFETSQGCALLAGKRRKNPKKA
jgi:hypothetical protein